MKNNKGLSKILKRFRDEIYGEDDALFDRERNNVSTQVENELINSIKQAFEETRFKELTREDQIKMFISSKEVNIYNGLIKDQEKSQEEWLKN